jgi:hypothetical protein
MTDGSDVQFDAAEAAAVARRVIASRIAELAPEVADADAAKVIAHLAEAYAQLAAEPPRVRA